MTCRYYTTMRPPAPGTVPLTPQPTRVRDYDWCEDTGFVFWPVLGLGSSEPVSEA